MTDVRSGGQATHLDHLLSDARMRGRTDRRDQAEYWSDCATGGMIATAHYAATRAGAEILARGGNAFDAAVAAGVALGVCEPAGSGIGGMAIVLGYDASRNRSFVVEGMCRAPLAATPELVAGTRNRYRGYRAIAVPTHLAVLGCVRSRYGTFDTETLLEPAIRIAEDGVPVTAVQHRNTADRRRVLRNRNAAPFFLDDQGAPPQPGTIFRQPVLAATLRRLATAGFEDFYRGGIARTIVADMQANGGFVTERDLESAQLYREGEPLSMLIGGVVFHGVGPPAGGVALLQMLNVQAHLGASCDPSSPEGAVLTAAIVRQARRDRRASRLTTDPHGIGDSVELLTDDCAARTADRIRREIADVPGIPADASERNTKPGIGETSHVSVMDAAGNAVALTQSIERSFGAAVATPTLGFLYNGHLRTFKLHNDRHPHYLRPGATARSNAAPTIGFRGGRPWVVAGSTGSERLASGMFQVLTRLHRQGPFDAVHAPRLHCTPDSQVFIESARYSPDVLNALALHGFAVEPVDPYAFSMGGLQLVVRHDGLLYGVGDPRRDGAASGSG